MSCADGLRQPVQCLSVARSGIAFNRGSTGLRPLASAARTTHPRVTGRPLRGHLLGSGRRRRVGSQVDGHDRRDSQRGHENNLLEHRFVSLGGGFEYPPFPMSKAGATAIDRELQVQTRRISGEPEPDLVLRGRAAVSVSKRAGSGPYGPISWRHSVCVLFWPECLLATISAETSAFPAPARLRRASSWSPVSKPTQDAHLSCCEG
jgi:hypothetical protein